MGRPARPTALVTGGNRGLGRAIAAGLVARGMRVVIGVRDLEAGRGVADAIGAQAVRMDVARLDSLHAAVDKIGGVDVLVNNAGVLIDANLLEDPGPFHMSIDVMFRGPYELIRACVPHMGAQGWGRIVNVSSDWGSFASGLEGPGAYGVAKAALNALTKALPRDLPEGVKVNAMCPGWVQTRMGGEGATRTPEEGAETAIWLADLPEDGPTGRFFRDGLSLRW
ncbi:SDR family NAD(P)-dependent oxidoreductase [Roseicyclus persicicus]|uniref:SDR family NAD(P)-dependent oxidoreductase n=1 Tax=Roseicyclus persicicus TaxID=2650661 RepID=A0A7X6GWT9_9RHOB|nr:SDR family NAD(P)-dependent oxidoreductase [Roseibacterium persicicum]NKX43850.1 SDR family NAD(P)-dependent oxidoreductase [Roseibacterium persicicum]